MEKWTSNSWNSPYMHMISSKWQEYSDIPRAEPTFWETKEPAAVHAVVNCRDSIIKYCCHTRTIQGCLKSKNFAASTFKNTYLWIWSCFQKMLFLNTFAISLLLFIIRTTKSAALGAGGVWNENALKFKDFGIFSHNSRRSRNRCHRVQPIKSWGYQFPAKTIYVEAVIALQLGGRLTFMFHFEKILKLNL